MSGCHGDWAGMGKNAVVVWVLCGCKGDRVPGCQCVRVTDQEVGSNPVVVWVLMSDCLISLCSGFGLFDFTELWFPID